MITFILVNSVIKQIIKQKKFNIEAKRCLYPFQIFAKYQVTSIVLIYATAIKLTI